MQNSKAIGRRDHPRNGSSKFPELSLRFDEEPSHDRKKTSDQGPFEFMVESARGI